MRNGTPSSDFKQLRSRYAEELPERLEELRVALGEAARNPPDSPMVTDAIALAHRFSGTAGTYGFGDAAGLAAECERLLGDYRAHSQSLPTWESLLEEFSKGRIISAESALQRLESSAPDTSYEEKGRILVIDDDRAFLAIIDEILRQSNYTPIMMTDARDVADLIESDRPDLILLDVEMPEIDGFTVCRAIRGEERWRDLPIVFLTAHNAVEDRIAAFQAGGDDYISKPIVAEELLARIDVRIQKGRMARERQMLLEQAEKHRDGLLSLLDQLQIGTLLLTEDDRVDFVSCYCDTIGLDPQKGINQHWIETLPLDRGDRRRFQEQLESVTDQRVKLELSWTKANRRYFVECEVRDNPTAPGQRIICLTDVSQLRRVQKELEESRHGRMVGNSDPMRELYALIDQVARGDWTVLIEGETGTGKELVAHSIHEASQRRDGPFIAVNSAGLSESLLASQLFGHRKGAFTGAVADQEGFFEAAHGGTIFLDEIGDLPASMQATLLRVLQEKEITRLGETRTRGVDVRILAATHKDLVTEVQEERFRRDLLYRLRVARIYVPALRERKADIPLLAEVFLGDSNQIFGLARPELDPEALRCLLSYDWPGNVRELKSAIDYASIHCRGERVRIADLPPEIGRGAPVPVSPSEPRLTAGDERSRILSALEMTGGNRVQAAKLLGMSRATFYRRLTKYGVSEEQ